MFLYADADIDGVPLTPTIAEAGFEVEFLTDTGLDEAADLACSSACSFLLLKMEVSVNIRLFNFFEFLFLLLRMFFLRPISCVWQS